MYSSQSQLIEQYLDYFFPSPGFFLEIGAWDGENISQTAYIEQERGWVGLCVDPFPVRFENRTCRICTKAISKDGAPRAFIKVSIDRRYGGDVSYFSGFKETVMDSIHWPIIEQFCDWEELKIETITFEDLYKLYALPQHIEFLSVDTEGSEIEIFESIDFDVHTFGLIAFEHNMNQDVRSRIGEILQSHGYELFEAWGYDDIYISQLMRSK